MKDLTQGKPLRTILIFALPLFICNIFQIFYSIGDSMVIGKFLGEDSLSAIGAILPLIALITSTISGAANGFSIVIAKYFGKKDLATLKNRIALTLVLGAFITLFFTLLSLVLVNPLIKMMNTDASLVDITRRYFLLMVSFLLLTMSYYLISGILRAVGDSLVPILFLIGTSILNLLLDILLLAIFNFSVEGIAIANIIAQFLSGLGCFIYMWKKYPELRLSKSDFKFEKEAVIEMLKHGLTLGLMMTIIQIGSVTLQSGINSLGKDYTTAHAIARRIGEAFMQPLATIGLACMTFASQNYGAKKYDRIKQGIIQCLYLSFIYSFIIAIINLAFSETLINIVTSNTVTSKDAISWAATYMCFNTSFYFILGMLFILRQSLPAFNHKMVSLIGGLIEMSFKVIITLVFLSILKYWAVVIIEPIIWSTAVIIMLIIFIKDKNLKIEPLNVE